MELIVFIDSHCHLNCLENEHETLPELIEKARKAGVTHMLCPGIDSAHFEQILDIARAYPFIKAGLGIHPNDVDQYAISENELYDWLDDDEVIAVGETGLDYYRNSADIKLQQSQFRLHIQVAKAQKKPLIIHAREAHADILRILEEEQAGPAILHCFTETLDVALAAIDLGCLISFSGIITFKNAGALREVVAALPIDKLLIETDAPYLAPTPYRGKMNQPAYVPLVAEKISEIKSLSVDEVARITSENFKNLMSWPC